MKVIREIHLLIEEFSTDSTIFIYYGYAMITRRV